MTHELRARLQQLQRAALAYASLLGWLLYRQDGITADGNCTCWRGRHCPPHRRGKHPARNGWKREATNDPALIRSWWSAVPFNPALMIPASMVILDLDDRSQLRALEPFGPWPITPTQRTGRGYVMCFRAPTDGGIWPRLSHVGGLKLETKGAGDSMTLAPSRHWNGSTYTWLPDRHPLRVPLVEIPPRFLAHVRSIATRKARAARRRPVERDARPVAAIIDTAEARALSISNGTGRAAYWLEHRLVDAGHPPHVVAAALASFHVHVDGVAA